VCDGAAPIATRSRARSALRCAALVYEAFAGNSTMTIRTAQTFSLQMRNAAIMRSGALNLNNDTRRKILSQTKLNFADDNAPLGKLRKNASERTARKCCVSEYTL
jgi:hypothetical protein